MFENRIEFESDESMSDRYDRMTTDRQRVFELLWDLKDGFGDKLFGRLTQNAESLLANSTPEEIGRRRFFRIAGPIKIQLPPYTIY
jgi:hypothetical protein